MHLDFLEPLQAWESMVPLGSAPLWRLLHVFPLCLHLRMHCLSKAGVAWGGGEGRPWARPQG